MGLSWREWYWTGEGEPDYGDQYFQYEELTEEGKREIKESEERMDKAFKDQKKQEDREKRKLKLIERKTEMDRPIDPFPNQELCEYEKLREKNIKEREEAMAASGLFEKLI